MEEKTIKRLAPKFIKLKQMPTKVLKMSGPLGILEIDVNIPKNVSLENDMVRMAMVEEANPAPDAYGNTCPLLPGDTIFCDGSMFTEVWQKGEMGKDGLKFVGLKNHIIAYERDKVLYGYLKFIPDRYEDELGKNRTGMHVYRPNSYLICKHRPDVFEKYMASSNVLNARELGLQVETNFLRTRGTHSIFEVISDFRKGEFLYTQFDHAIEITIDPADIKAHSLETILSRGTYHGIEAQVVKATLNIELQEA